MTYKEIELKLINRAISNLKNDIDSHLQAINQLIPNFTSKQHYAGSITSVFERLYADEQLRRAILDSKTDELFESICMLDQSSLDYLGLADLCGGS